MWRRKDPISKTLYMKELKTVDNLKKNTNFFLQTSGWTLESGSVWKKTPSVWLHIQVSDQLHALSDLTHGIQPPPHPPNYLRRTVYDPTSRPSCGGKRPSSPLSSIMPRISSLQPVSYCEKKLRFHTFPLRNGTLAENERCSCHLVRSLVNSW
jgi:hypothetical protein